MNNHLVVVSLLDGKGPTGVETHFNQVLDAARAAAIDGILVSAYPAQRWWATLARKLLPLVRLVNAEHAEIMSLRINSAILSAKLAALLGSTSGPVTLYAQDPLSACIALNANRAQRCRVVIVIHYNTSQSDELLIQGAAARGGPLCRFIDAAEARALARVDHIIFVSTFMQKEIARRMPATGSVPQSVIPHCAGRAVVQCSAPPPGNDLIAIGTLEPRKNQAFLLQVLAQAKVRGFCYTLTLVGNGPDHAMLAALTRQLGLQKQVTFAGFQKNAAGLIAQHRMLVHAALAENLPITLIEALAVGRPILAPAVGGIPEIFSHGVEGYFWPLDDPAAAAILLIQALGDGPTYQRLAYAAHARYQEKFHCDQLAGQWLAAILNRQQRVPVMVP